MNIWATSDSTQSKLQIIMHILVAHRLVDKHVGYPGIKCYCGVMDFPSHEYHVAEIIMRSIDEIY